MVMHQIVTFDLKSGYKDDLVQALKDFVITTKVFNMGGFTLLKEGYHMASKAS